MDISSSHIDKYKLLGERLKKARIDCGYTQIEVANLLNKPQWFISRIETGSRKIDVIELIELSKIYKKSIYYFLKNL